MNGLVHIYTGDGKGKTTAALGLGIRAIGSGMKVLMVQFCKGSTTSEENTIEKLKPDFELYKLKDICKFAWQMTDQEKKTMHQNTSHLIKYVAENAQNKDMIILDEIMAAIANEFIDVTKVIEFINNKPSHLEVVLTGRNAPKELIDIADYVSEIKAIKHPMNSGIVARKGIEF